MKKDLEKLVVEFLRSVDEDIKLRDYQVGHYADIRRKVTSKSIEPQEVAEKVIAQLRSDGVELKREQESELTSLIDSNF